MKAIGTIREFHTKQFSIVVDAVEEDSLDLSFDDTGEVREKLESGEYVAFCARARAFYAGHELANDYLGGCIYKSLEEFADHRECGKHNRANAVAGNPARCGSYFADMVHTVVREARDELRAMQSVKVRP